MDTTTPIGDELEDLVARCLAEAERDGPEAIERFCREHPDSAYGLRRRIQRLIDAGFVEPTRTEPEARRFGPYEVTERLGGGGMGLVFRARRTNPDREAALKVVRPELLHFGDARRRFEREVAVVAKLSHPGIVPVFESGDEDGAPWFAMELVRGATLAAVLGELGERDPAKLTGRDLRAALFALLPPGTDAGVDAPLFSGSWTEACVELGAQVAIALDHAHREGVLHRDVKPSNVLLGLDGRARLFDFGLALPDDALELTRTGAQVGSLPYMAPEQLESSHADRRTDVYALGTLLYELLGLQPAFPQRDPARLRAAIVAGEVTPLRKHAPSVPRDLEVVVHEALAREPGARYATAADLARDLRRVLALEPIAARPPSAWRRARAYARRRPALTVAAGATAVFLLVFPSALAIQRGMANREIQGALEQADEQRRRADEQRARADLERERAEANLDTALGVVDGLLVELGVEGLREIPGMSAVRAGMLDEALELYDELLAQRPGDEALVRARAELLLESSSVELSLGGRAEAAERIEEAIAVHREAFDGSDDARRRLALALCELGRQRAGVGDFDAALPAYAEAEELLQGAASFALLEARRHARRGGALALEESGDADGALRLADLAVADGEEVLRRDPRGPASRLGLCEALSARADAYDDLGDPARALDDLERAASLAEELATEDPRAKHLLRLGVVATSRASLLFTLGRADEIEPALRAGAAALQRLVDEYPAIPAYRRRLALAHESRAFVHLGAKRPEEAVPYLREAHGVLFELRRLDPEDLDVRKTLARATHNLANALVEVRTDESLREAADLAEDAAREWEALADANVSTALGVSAFARIVEAQAKLVHDRIPDPDRLAEVVETRAARNPSAWSALGSALAATAEHLASNGAAADDVDFFAGRAVDALRAAIDRGYTNAERLHEDPVLDVLRARDDFRRELTRLPRD